MKKLKKKVYKVRENDITKNKDCLDLLSKMICCKPVTDKELKKINKKKIKKGLP